MTGKEVYEISKEWNLTSYAACLAFSDWLLEHDEIKWANLARWVSCHMWQRPYGGWGKDLNYWFKLGSNNNHFYKEYHHWLAWAVSEGLEEIPSQTPADTL